MGKTFHDAGASGGGGRRQKGRGAESRRGDGGGSREVSVSKKLSYLLRHGAEKERIELDDGGWVNVDDVLRWRGLAQFNVTLEELYSIVLNNDKSRYAMKANPNHDNPLLYASSPRSESAHGLLTSSDPRAYLIRASQGHSLKGVSSEKTLEPFTPSHPLFPASGYVVHGTFTAAWTRIQASGGLKPMTRLHIHFATNVPPPLPPLDSTKAQPVRTGTPVEDQSDRPDAVVSGMRRDATILVWADVRGSIERGGIKWWRSDNGVILTEGDSETRLLGLEWCGWVERRGTNEVLYGSKPGPEVLKLIGKTVAGGESADSKDGGVGVAGGNESGLKDNWDD